MQYLGLYPTRCVNLTFSPQVSYDPHAKLADRHKIKGEIEKCMKLAQQLMSPAEKQIMLSYDPGPNWAEDLQDNVLTTAPVLARKVQEYVNVVTMEFETKKLQAALWTAAKALHTATENYRLFSTPQNNAAHSAAVKMHKECKANAEKGHVLCFSRQTVSISAMGKRIGEVEGKVDAAFERALKQKIKEGTHRYITILQDKVAGKK